jgi:hypothetical protein
VALRRFATAASARHVLVLASVAAVCCTCSQAPAANPPPAAPRPDAPPRVKPPAPDPAPSAHARPRAAAPSPQNTAPKPAVVVAPTRPVYVAPTQILKPPRPAAPHVSRKSTPPTHRQPKPSKRIVTPSARRAAGPSHAGDKTWIFFLAAILAALAALAAFGTRRALSGSPAPALISGPALTSAAPALTPAAPALTSAAPALTSAAAKHRRVPLPKSCEIAWWRGYVKSDFYIVVQGPEGAGYKVSRSPSFRCPSGEEPPQTDAIVAAHAVLVESLAAEGWNDVGVGESWYAHRFRRRP